MLHRKPTLMAARAATKASDVKKASGAFLTISEVSDTLDVAKHVLRFWEQKFPSIRPMKRGGGRRFYRPEDVELLRGIRHLLQSEAVTIKGVQKIIREQGLDAVKQFGAQDDMADGANLSSVIAPSSAHPQARLAESIFRPVRPRKPERGINRTAVAPAVKRRAAIERAVTELEQCRVILAGTDPTQRQTKRSG